LLEGDPDLEHLYEAGEAARTEVERISTLRSLRMLRGGRLRQADRLDDAIRAASKFGALLGELMANAEPPV